MHTQHQIQDAMRILSDAFAPFACHIMAARKGNFSFTVVDQTGVAKHSQRLYPEQYSSEGLPRVIERARQSLRA